MPPRGAPERLAPGGWWHAAAGSGDHVAARDAVRLANGQMGGRFLGDSPVFGADLRFFRTRRVRSCPPAPDAARTKANRAEGNMPYGKAVPAPGVVFHSDKGCQTWVQGVVATSPAVDGFDSSSSRASAGVFQSRVLRGRRLRAVATAVRSSALCLLRSVPLGKYWRSSPLVFSLVPRCQGLCGSQKNTWRPVSMRSWACWAISAP